ncbi:hypothetical protein [Streptomyces sp. NBC_01445]|nr:hypothetical protein [Streptomyces sp. NBC_01445]WSE03872.1 hypothetical protein OG574_11110 [Streptomyces sp. NBC_01445]
MKRLAQELPPVSATVDLVIGKLLAWDHKPGIWVDLMASSHDAG